MRLWCGDGSNDRGHPVGRTSTSASDDNERRADTISWTGELESKCDSLRRQYLSKLYGYERSQMRYEPALHDPSYRSKFEKCLCFKLVARHSASSHAQHLARRQLCRQSRDETARPGIHKCAADRRRVLPRLHTGTDCGGCSSEPIESVSKHDYSFDSNQRDRDSNRAAAERQVSVLLVHLHGLESAAFQLQRRADNVD